nr:beta-1,3-galactosyltransferase brn [Leptinotarsa decemlineata]
MILSRRIKRYLFLLLLICFLYLSGVFHHLFERDFYDDFHYPYDGDIEPFVEKLKNNVTPEVAPINSYQFKFNKPCLQKCSKVQNLRLVYIVKSSPDHLDRRNAIRSTWGYEHRFSDVEIRTVFLVGTGFSNHLQESLDKESHKYDDIVQGNFIDSYFNNTYKTMMGLQWAVQHCHNSKFYMFVDDDYYISTKNVLRFIRYPTNYPKYLKEPMSHIQMLLKNRRPKQVDFELEDTVRLYAGYVFISSPHRHFTSKWYVSLSEYPYHMWPPYVTAGAYVLSRGALIDMHYSSFYTKHFRFDDIYLGLVAYKAKIEPYYCDEFHFYKKSYDKFGFKYTVATHGYGDPKELIQIWTEQKSLGNA